MIDLVKFLEQNSVKFIDFRFTDLIGKSHNITYNAEDKHIAEMSTVKLLPDIQTIFLDPFCVHSTAVVLCDYGSRLVAKKAYDHILSTEIIDNIQLSFEIWFSIFDEAKISHNLHVKLSHVEDYLSIKKHSSEDHNFNSNLDPLSDLRSEMLLMMKESNVENPLYHKRISSCQGAIKVGYGSLLESIDNIQKSKHIIRNVAHSYGKTATLMPNPTAQGGGNHLSLDHLLLKNNRNLPEIHSHYIGGVMQHIEAVNAFTNPTANSYRNPSILPLQSTLSFPDAIANPYLCAAAILMAGLDGIQNKINITEQQPAKSLNNALEALDKDREFLLRGGIFTNEQIDKYIKIKQEEIKSIESIIHPAEFIHYYNI